MQMMRLWVEIASNCDSSIVYIDHLCFDDKVERFQDEVRSNKVNNITRLTGFIR